MSGKSESKEFCFRMRLARIGMAMKATSKALNGISESLKAGKYDMAGACASDVDCCVDEISKMCSEIDSLLLSMSGTKETEVVSD